MDTPDMRPSTREEIDAFHDNEEGVDSPSAAEAEAKKELIEGTLCGRSVFVPTVKQWRASAIHALREGDFDTWAEATLDDGDLDWWMDSDPTLGEIEKFFATVNPGLGSGNSRASRRSSTRNRARGR